MNPHAYTEDQLVEQPAIRLFSRDLLPPRLLFGQIDVESLEHA